MKKYLKIEYGSRGEMEVVGLVESSKDEIQKELDLIVEGCEDGEEEYYEEFMFVGEDVEKGVIEVCVSEEESYTYFDYELNKEMVDEVLRIDSLCKEEKMSWSEGDELVDKLLSKII